MNVLGHDHVAPQHELVTLAHLLQHAQEQITPPSTPQPALTMITTAGDKVQMVRTIVAFETAGHRQKLAFWEENECDA